MIQVRRTGGKTIGFHPEFLENGDVKVAQGPSIPARSFETVMMTSP